MKALLIVDMQNDFMSNGPLAVPNADRLIPLINRLMLRFDVIVATQDWHPANHVSFAINHPGKKVGDLIQVAGFPQALWPVHCVQYTPGAELVSSLNMKGIQAHFQKGTDPNIDSYSIFFDNARLRSTGLEVYLRKRKVTEVYIAGVATDYCVLYSAFDAMDLGFTTYIIVDACAGINVQKGDVEKSLEAIAAIGAKLIKSDAII